MAKGKVAAQKAAEEVKDEVVQEQVGQAAAPTPAEEVEALKNELEELKAKVAAGDEESLKRVCKAMNVSYDEVVEKEVASKGREEDLIEFDIGRHRVNINGTIYTGKIRCAASVKEVIDQAVGDTRMRHMREKFGNDYQIAAVAGTVTAPKIVGRVNEHGEQL